MRPASLMRWTRLTLVVTEALRGAERLRRRRLVCAGAQREADGDDGSHAGAVAVRELPGARDRAVHRGRRHAGSGGVGGDAALAPGRMVVRGRGRGPGRVDRGVGGDDRAWPSSTSDGRVPRTLRRFHAGLPKAHAVGIPKPAWDVFALPGSRWAPRRHERPCHRKLRIA